MDETLSRRAAFVLAAYLLCGVAAATPDLQDPTRPPAAAGLARDAAPAPDAAPVLQSVQVGKAQRRSAVIDGESVRVGEHFRGARVTRIADNEVELLRGRERQVLRLYAPADGGMTPVASAVAPAVAPAVASTLARSAKGE
jgi:MSHA biogenesis protein MshK